MHPNELTVDLQGLVLEPLALELPALLVETEEELARRAGSPHADPQGPRTGDLRIARGGSFQQAPMFCRSSSRTAVSSEQESPFTGFRVVVEAEDLTTHDTR